MGKVAITYNILPESPEINLNSLSDSISKGMPKGAEIKGLVVNPIAFGLNAIKILVIVEDAPGIADALEKNISAIKGVQSVEVVETELV